MVGSPQPRRRTLHAKIRLSLAAASLSAAAGAVLAQGTGPNGGFSEDQDLSFARKAVEELNPVALENQQSQLAGCR
jgi:hypothetical protein